MSPNESAVLVRVMEGTGILAMECEEDLETERMRGVTVARLVFVMLLW